jgi:hypothetical protein
MDPSEKESKATGRYSDQIREMTFQIWAFKAGRRPQRTMELLLEEFPVEDPVWQGKYPENLPSFLRLIKYWIKTGAWGERVNEHFREIAPDIREKTIQSLIVGAEEASVFLREVINLHDPHNIHLKTKIEAAKLLLTHGGFNTVGNMNPVLEHRHVEPSRLHELLGDDEVAALQAQLGNDDGIVEGTFVEDPAPMVQETEIDNDFYNNNNDVEYLKNIKVSGLPAQGR